MNSVELNGIPVLSNKIEGFTDRDVSGHGRRKVMMKIGGIWTVFN